MKMKRFKATNMRTALAQIHDEFGDDAVILETTNLEQGVEVSAAIDYESTDFTQSTTSAIPATDIGGSIDYSAGDDESCFTLGTEKRPVERYLSAGQNGSTSEPSDKRMQRMGEEVRSIRYLLEEQLSRLIWDEKARRTPESASITRNFSRLGLTEEVVTQLIGGMGDLRQLDNMWTTPLTHLARSIPMRNKDMVFEGGTFAIVGPTGVGKTTTIAKLAARYALRNNPKDIALVTTDSFRVAAREQLETFGQIIGTPVYQANDSKELGDLLHSLINKKLVLIDTAGMGQNDVRLAGQLGCLLGAEVEMEVLLALPANAQTRAIEGILDAFKIVQPSGCILTKTDEAGSLGGSLSALIRSGLPLAYVTNGQRVPEDLHFARPRSTWLVKAAVELMDHSSTTSNGEFLPDYFPEHITAPKTKEINIHACA